MSIKSVCRAGLPRPHWPPRMQQEWDLASRRVDSPFREDHGGQRPQEITWKWYESCLRQLLGFCDRSGALLSSMGFDAVTKPEVLDPYLVHLRDERGNVEQTIQTRFAGLSRAFSWIFLDQDFTWINRIVRNVLPVRKQPRFAPASHVLLDWAEELFEAAFDLPSYYRCIQIRDAAMIGVLTVVAPRLRSLCGMELGTNTVKRGAEWCIDFEEHLMKEGNDLHLVLGPAVNRMLDRYIAVERRDLLGPTGGDYVWVSARGGGPLRDCGVWNQVRDRSLRKFGKALSPHRFRTSLATTNALYGTIPSDSSAVLGHLPTETQRNYNRATAIMASRRQSELISRLRRETEELARRFYSER